MQQIEEKEQLSLDPNLWDDPKKAEALLRELKSHKNWVNKYNKIQEVVDDAEVLLEFQKMGEASEEEVDALYDMATLRLPSILKEIDDITKLTFYSLYK